MPYAAGQAMHQRLAKSCSVRESRTNQHVAAAQTRRSCILVCSLTVGLAFWTKLAAVTSQRRQKRREKRGLEHGTYRGSRLGVFSGRGAASYTLRPVPW